MGEMIRLNIGCGKTDNKNYIGIDACEYPHVKYHDVKCLPYDSGVVSIIYCSHLISYFDRDEIIPILKEWNRVLKHGGLLVVSVPDWDVLKTLPRPLLGPLYGKMGDPSIYHKTVYNYDELFQVLRLAGFIHIERTLNSLEDQSKATYDGQLISLTVNAIKP